MHSAGHLRLGCDQADSLLASPFGFVIEGSVPLRLAKKLCNPPLFSAGDELLKGSGDSGFFWWALRSLERLDRAGVGRELKQPGPSRNTCGVDGSL